MSSAAQFDTGGTVDIAPPAFQAQSPMVQQLYRYFQAMPLDRLEQLHVMVPPSSPQGQMIGRALQAKQMAPASQGAFPSAPGAQPFPSMIPQQRRGGGVPRRAPGGFAGLTPSTLGPNLAFTPESGFGHGSTEPWLQQEANLTSQGLTPQQVTQAMMISPPPMQPTASPPSASPTPTTRPISSPSPSPAPSPVSGPLPEPVYGFPSWGGGFGGSGFPIMGGGFYGGGYGGSAFARPGYFSLPMASFSAGNPGLVGQSWAPTMPWSGSPLPTPPKGAPAGGIAYWTNPSTGAGYIQQPNGTWTDYNGTSVPPNSIPPQSPTPPVKVTPSPLAAPVASASTAASAAASAPTSSAPPGLPSEPTNGYSPFGYAGGGAAHGHAAPGMGDIGLHSLGFNRQLMPSAESSGASLYHPGGFISSPVAGRTDHLPLALPVDSHVIPADVVSGIGQGNSLAGATLLDRMFHAGPWGGRAAKIADARPRAEPAREATTPILAAGGEYVVRPEAVLRLGEAAKHRDPARRTAKSAKELGHDLIDDFILRARKHVIATTRKLPGPVRS